MGWKRTLATAIARREWIGRPVKAIVRSRAVTKLPIYQNHALRRATELNANIAKMKPWVLIETTLTCNAACVMCMHGHKDMRGEMSIELYEKIIREAADWGIPYVSLSVYGEPFADRHWIERIEIARQYGLNYRVVTNGSILREEVLKRMFELGGWEEVIFSINGFSTEAYEKMMPPLKRDKIYGNVDRFLEMKKSLGKDEPRVAVSCVVTNINAHERHDYKRYWKAKPGIADVLMADCGSWLGELDMAELTVNGSKRHIGKDAWLAPCPSPWSQLTVLHDGRVVPCCEDHAARSLIVGDTNRNTLKEIFLGPELTTLRQQHMTNHRCDNAVCAKCQLNPPWL
jgi:radical SAM protein with 4Fe4S-binding SPASM domain